jgi:hypothetical protein
MIPIVFKWSFFCFSNSPISIDIPYRDFHSDLHLSFGSDSIIVKAFHSQDVGQIDNGIISVGTLSMLGHASYSCDSEPTLVHIYKAYPWMEKYKHVWNPVTSRFSMELNHALVFTKDVSAGDQVVLRPHACDDNQGKPVEKSSMAVAK